MIVPAFWAEARRRYRRGSRQVTVRRFGWSDVSPDDARAMAEARAEEALRAVLAGETLVRREPKVPYNGAEGVPIREEIVARHGDVVVTRNAYGARCLNTPDVLFADVDFPLVPSVTSRLLSLVLLAGFVALAVALWVYLGWPNACVATWVAAAAFAMVGQLIPRPRVPPEAEPVARERIARFLDEYPDWAVRLYHTPAGLRLLVTHQPFSPDDEVVGDFFRAIGADPVYVRMCRNQKCFRARLTAKPWRAGIAEHIKPRPGVWPVRPERLPDRAAWVTAYEERAAGFAACRFVESVGSGVVHPRVAPVVVLHDAECRANDPDLPLA
jgi:hypothetical protein